MEKLNPIWFLESPLDIEHKSYVLLDFLKNKSQNLDGPSVLSSLKEISTLVKAMNSFKERRKIPESLLTGSSKEALSEYNKITVLPRENAVLKEIDEIISSSLEILYEFSEICLEIIKEEEEKIKIFKLESKYDRISGLSESGVLLIRNMVTERLIPYYWRETIMNTGESKKDIIVMKKISLNNKKFSLSYEHIYHEILSEMGADKNFTPAFYVVEIYESFSEKSDILKLAKDKFIETLSKRRKQ
jgi:hypothetical protein